MPAQTLKTVPFLGQFLYFLYHIWDTSKRMSGIPRLLENIKYDIIAHYKKSREKMFKKAGAIPLKIV